MIPGHIEISFDTASILWIDIERIFEDHLEAEFQEDVEENSDLSPDVTVSKENSKFTRTSTNDPLYGEKDKGGE